MQSQANKKLRESDFDITMSAGGHSIDIEKARWEAMSIRSEIESGTTIDG